MIKNREIPQRGFYESDASFEANLLWHDFYETIYYKNRFFLKHRILEILSEYISKNVLEIEVGSIYYRARIIDDSSTKELMLYKCFAAPEEERLDVKFYRKSNSFRGFTKEGSFVPPKGVNVSDGRANPKYVKYLYMAEDPTTAIFEVRPFIYDAVNVAKIKVNKPLKIANIAVDIDLSSKSETTIDMHVMGIIQGAFSRPTNDIDDYIPTQIIAEYIKSLGYDGIRFNSSLYSNGVNLTIFNYDICEAISSQDFRIENIKLTARAAFGSAEYHGDMCYIVDNEPKYLDFENFPFMDSEIIKNKTADE